MGKRTRLARRTYTDPERVAALVALDANGGNVPKTARQLGYPAATLRRWSNGSRRPYVASLARLKRGDMADAFRDAVWSCLGVAVGKVEAAPLNHLMTAAGIAVDKMRVLEGAPTGVNANHTANPNVDVSRLTSDERQQLADLLRKTRPDAEPDSPAVG